MSAATTTNGIPEQIEPGLSPGERRFLRYWSVTMVLVRQCDWHWIPGFSYHEDEVERLRELAARVPPLARLAWLLASATIFLLAGVGAIVLLMSCAFIVGWRNAGDVTASGSYAVLVMALILALAAGGPLSLVWGGGIAERLTGPPRQTERSTDAKLLYRIRKQFRQVGATLATLFVFAALLWLMSLR